MIFFQHGLWVVPRTLCPSPPSRHRSRWRSSWTDSRRRHVLLSPTSFFLETPAAKIRPWRLTTSGRPARRANSSKYGVSRQQPSPSAPVLAAVEMATVFRGSDQVGRRDAANSHGDERLPDNAGARRMITSYLVGLAGGLPQDFVSHYERSFVDINTNVDATPSVGSAVQWRRLYKRPCTRGLSGVARTTQTHIRNWRQNSSGRLHAPARYPTNWARFPRRLAYFFDATRASDATAKTQG